MSPAEAGSGRNGNYVMMLVPGKKPHPVAYPVDLAAGGAGEIADWDNVLSEWEAIAFDYLIKAGASGTLLYLGGENIDPNFGGFVFLARSIPDVYDPGAPILFMRDPQTHFLVREAIRKNPILIKADYVGVKGAVIPMSNSLMVAVTELTPETRDVNGLMVTRFTDSHAFAHELKHKTSLDSGFDHQLLNDLREIGDSENKLSDYQVSKIFNFIIERMGHLEEAHSLDRALREGTAVQLQEEGGTIFEFPYPEFYRHRIADVYGAFSVFYVESVVRVLEKIEFDSPAEVLHSTLRLIGDRVPDNSIAPQYNLSNLLPKFFK